MTSSANSNLGYSLAEGPGREKWISLISRLHDMTHDTGLAEQYVFHGTSLKKARRIMRVGMMPMDAEHAILSSELAKNGSFWGTVETAVSYAEDTVFERDEDNVPTINNPPALIAVPISFLQERTRLTVDCATLDFPLQGLTDLELPEVQEKWTNGHEDMTWLDSLRDLKAILALHENMLKLEGAVLLFEPNHVLELEGQLTRENSSAPAL